MSNTISKTTALKIARAQVGPLYTTGRKQYAFNTFDVDRGYWFFGPCSWPYAAARRYRADAVAIRALLARGVEYEDAYRSVYA
jgi:hypothetical protein